MISKRIEIKLPEGLEARPIALLVQVASQYESSVYVESEDKKVNAKSIMGMMSLALPSGRERCGRGEGPGKYRKISLRRIEKKG